MAFKDLAINAEAKRDGYDALESFYESEHRLDALGVTLPEDVRVLEMVSSIPKLTVDVLVEVLNVEGFILKDSPETAELLWKWWQANDMDTEIHLGITETLVQGLSFLLVGYGTEDVPRITVVDAQHAAYRRDVFGNVVEAVVILGDDKDKLKDHVDDERIAVHYVPGYRAVYRPSSLGWKIDGGYSSTGTGKIPLVPMVNRSRLKDRNYGRTEMAEVLTLSNAESRSLTNLQVAQELLALPQRYLFANGINKLKDQDGNPISKFKAYMSALWTGPEGATAGQFAGADLSQIINVIKLYNQKVSALMGIPPSMLGIATDNPSSAEAMRAAKERLITRGEFKQSLFGDPIEEAMTIALEMYGKAPKGIEYLETSWRDVATPSKSAKSANILQAHSQGVVTAHTAREYLELTPAQRSYEDQQENSADALMRSVGMRPGQSNWQNQKPTEDDESKREEKAK